MPVNNNREIHITKSDYERIKQQINFNYCFMPSSNNRLESIVRFEQILDRATIVANEFIPAGTVMINSQVKMAEIETGVEIDFTLTLPTPAYSIEKKISIFSPLGCAVIGCRTGDIIECAISEGIKKFVVKSITNCMADTSA